MKRQKVAIQVWVLALALNALSSMLFADAGLSVRERLTAWRTDNVRQCRERLKGADWAGMPSVDLQTDMEALTTNLLAKVCPTLASGVRLAVEMTIDEPKAKLGTCDWRDRNGVVHGFAAWKTAKVERPMFLSSEGLSARGRTPIAFVKDELVLGSRPYLIKGFADGRKADGLSVRGRFSDLPYENPFGTGWFFFVDDEPYANWSHPCRYVFVSEGLDAWVVLYSNEPPVVLSGGRKLRLDLLDSVEKKQSGSISLETFRTALMSANALESNALDFSGDTAHSYAILISGGADSESNYSRYWGDMAMVYSTLRQKYKLPKDHITVCMSDGTSTGYDMLDTGTKQFKDSPKDLDGDGVGDIDYDARKGTIRSVLTSWASKLTENDQLFVFVTDHGAHDNSTGRAYLVPWEPTGGASGCISTDELSSWLADFKSPVAVAMEYCYSGPFISPIVKTAKRAVGTACGDEPSSAFYVTDSAGGGYKVTGAFDYCNPYAWAFNSAIRGVDSAWNWSPWQDTGKMSVGTADADGDGKVSFYEAAKCAQKYILAGLKNGNVPLSFDDSPQYGESASGFGATFFLAKKAAPAPTGPANDNFASAKTIVGKTGSVQGSNVGATPQGGEPLVVAYPSASTTIWWKWTASTTGTVTFDTKGTGFDTVMGVYTGSSLTSLSEKARDNDGGGSQTSSCKVSCSANTDYYICVAGYGGKSGTVKLNWSHVAPLTLTSLQISGVYGLRSGESGTLVCKGFYSDGTVKPVIPTWQLTGGSAYAELKSGGVLAAKTVWSNQKATVKASYSGKTATQEVNIWPNVPAGFSIDASGVLTSYYGSEPDVTIPAGVTAIKEWAFFGRSKVRSLTMPSTVKSIGRWAFSGCSGLAAISLPAGLTDLGEYAFDGCEALKTVTLPSGLAEVKQGLFRKCLSLESVGLPSSATSIGDRAFYECSSLKSVTIPSRVKTVGESVFYKCLRLTSARVSSTVLESIGERCFYGCRSLESITLPTSLRNLGARAFTDCSSLSSIAVPNGVTSINEWTFANCEALTSVVLPQGLSSIGENAFYSCSSLKSAVLPSTVRQIGSRAFEYCETLKAVKIPEGVVTLPENVFWGCYGLESVTLPSSLKSIASGAFRCCNSLKSVLFPAGLNSVDVYAFSDCAQMTEFRVAAGNVSYSAVNGMLLDKSGKTLVCCPAGRTSAEIPAGVSRIGDDAFYYCRRLESVTLPEGVTAIGAEAFYFCEKLSSVTLPSTLTTIGRLAFRLSGLKSVTIPGSVTEIGSGAFNPGLQTIYVDQGDESRAGNLLSASGVDVSGCEFVPLVQKYDIRFIRNDGAGTLETKTFEHGVESALPKLSELGWARRGFTFNGWATSAADANATPIRIWKKDGAVVSTPTKARMSLDAYASWTLKDGYYQIKFNRNDGSGKWRGLGYAYGAETRLPSCGAEGLGWSRAGYVFLGWATSAANAAAGKVWREDRGMTRTPVEAGKTLNVYAVWRPTGKSYKIRFIRNDGAGTMSTSSFGYGVAAKLPTLATLGWARRGYDFRGWASTSANATLGKVWQTDGATVSTLAAAGSSVDAYAIWALKGECYQIKFNKNDGTGKWRALGYEHGVQTTLPSCVAGLGWTYPGYVFAGWATSAANATAGKVWREDCGKTATPVAAGKTLILYAVWRLPPKSYQILFHRNDGSGMTVLRDFEVGKSANLPRAVKDLGWTSSTQTFKGWSYSPMGLQVDLRDGVAVRDLTAQDTVFDLYAVWQESGLGDFVIDAGTVTAYSGMGGAVTIPSGVKAIGSSAFAWSSVVSVAIPSGVTDIGTWAFAGCGALQSVAIPSSVKTIGMGAFLGCSALKTVYVNSGDDVRVKSLLKASQFDVSSVRFVVRSGVNGPDVFSAPATASSAAAFETPHTAFEPGYVRGVFADGSGAFDLLLYEGGTAFFAAQTEDGYWSEECDADLVGNTLLLSFEDGDRLILRREDGQVMAEK